MNLELEKRVEERSAEFQKSEEKYHSLIEQASDAIYVLDFKGNFTDFGIRMCDFSRLGNCLLVLKRPSPFRIVLI